MNLKLNLTESTILSTADYLYNEIIFSKSNRNGQKIRGISILVREIGNPDNLVIVDLHNPEAKIKFECIENALMNQQKGKRLTGIMTIEVENRIFQASVSGMLPEENDLLAIVSLLKALDIKKVILIEKGGIPTNFLNTNNYIGKIFKKVA